MKTSLEDQFIVLSLLWTCCGLMSLLLVVGADGIERRNGDVQYCPYFKNRGPSRQENLRNCSWYKENSCCHDEEIEFAFRQLSPLEGANGQCAQYMNYLYCYICAPNQNTFFKDFTLTVCEEFCDHIYNACQNAILKGRKLEHVYKSGQEFCKARRFKTDKEAHGKCFTYKGKPNTKSASQQLSVNSKFVAVLGMLSLIAKHCVLLWGDTSRDLAKLYDKLWIFIRVFQITQLKA